MNDSAYQTCGMIGHDPEEHAFGLRCRKCGLVWIPRGALRLEPEKTKSRYPSRGMVLTVLAFLAVGITALALALRS